MYVRLMISPRSALCQWNEGINGQNVPFFTARRVGQRAATRKNIESMKTTKAVSTFVLLSHALGFRFHAGVGVPSREISLLPSGLSSRGASLLHAGALACWEEDIGAGQK
jgi:hypothetical protein